MKKSEYHKEVASKYSKATPTAHAIAELWETIEELQEKINGNNDDSKINELKGRVGEMFRNSAKHKDCEFEKGYRRALNGVMSVITEIYDSKPD